MSSSRIFKQGGGNPLTLEPFGCAPLQPPQELFRPLRLGGEESDPAEAEPEEVAEAPAAPPSIPEEEALRMVREARTEGVREGRAEAEAEFAAASGALAQGLAAAAALHPQLMHDAEEALLKLSVLIARKVMLREFSFDPGLLAGVVRGALELASDGGEIVVRLNPDDHAVVADTLAFQLLLRENPGITLKADPGTGRAGCLLETARGNIDAGMDAQLDEILRRLFDERSARREEQQGD